MNEYQHREVEARQLGNYRLTRLLGQGMSSEVYLGEHVLFHSPAAVKILHGYSEQAEVQKFLARAEVLSHLRHPNIVSVLEYGIEGNNAFLIMDYAPYGTIRERYPKGTRLPLSTVVRYVKQISSALHYVHQHN